MRTFLLGSSKANESFFTGSKRKYNFVLCFSRLNSNPSGNFSGVKNLIGKNLEEHKKGLGSQTKFTMVPLFKAKIVGPLVGRD